jgi:hypothetical protein
MVTHQKPASRLIVRTQRVDRRSNPNFGGGIAWGQPNWPDSVSDTALNITELIFGRRVAPFDTLGALQANATWGNGQVIPYNGGASFTTGQFIRLGDNTTAWYNTTGDVWSAGTAP